MLFRKTNALKSSFHAPIGPSVVIGTVGCILFYGLIFAGPLDYAILRRYCLCHPVAIATTELFLVALVALTSKWITGKKQSRLNQRAALALEELTIGQPDSQTEVPHKQKPQWLHTLWQTQGAAVCDSWFGQRVHAVLQRQIKRKNTVHLNSDLQELSERDADSQHDSYGLIRIVTWAMPMLGFLGTVLGISDTLGQMDAQALASGSQEAMNSLTAGLYVAFDTTAIGLVLTMVAMFVQFGVNRFELTLLVTIDNKVSEAMHLCLSEQEQERDTTEIVASLQVITSELVNSMQQLVQKQSEIWENTISTAHAHWQDLTTRSSDTLQLALAGAIESAMSKFEGSLGSHTEQLARLQTEGAVLIDSRWQQWQTTLSEQARVAHQQQRDMHQQTELLNTLIEKNDAIRSMEAPLQATLERLTDVDRFHDAAICLTEAIAVLGTQMERYGFLGRKPIRRKEELDGDALQPNTTLSEEDDSNPITIPLQRHAG